MRLLTTVSMLALLSFATPALADDYVIMKVNTQDVTASEANKFWEGLFPAGQAPAFDSIKPDVRDKILRGIMAEKLVYGEALAKGVDKSDTVQKQLEDIKRKLVVRTFLDQKTSDAITDADLKKEYDSAIAANKDDKEVHARHILLNSEQDAIDARKKIDGGKSFDEVAREYSKDAGSAKNGGDLGYFTKDQMVKEFSDAAFAMKKGDISGPVKSPFGWHIIKVEDVRKITPPPFDQVKEQLRAKLQEKRLNEYVESLVKAADVKEFDAKGKEVPFNKHMPADTTTKALDKDKAPLVVKVDKPADVKTDAKADKSTKSTPPATH